MKHFVIWLVLGVVGLPLVYLLACGPLNYMFARGWISQRTTEMIGAPENWAGDRGLLKAVGLAQPLYDYNSWWSRCAH